MKRVMKGEQIEDLSVLTFPKIASPKVDGFRCVVSDVPRTSRMGLFPNKYVHKKLAGLLPAGVILDGEIVVGKKTGGNVLSRTSSGVTSQDGKPDFTLWVFDAPRAGVTQLDRLKLAKRHVKSLDNPRVKLLKHVVVYSLEELIEFIDWCLEHGFEGVMIKDPEGAYKEGKATLRQQNWVKYKPFVTAEARVTGYYEEMENTNEAKRETTGKLKRSSAKSGKVPKGTLGGFIGIDIVTGVEVRCGGGFSKAQRKAFWEIRDQIVKEGWIFTYSKQKIGEKDKPRHPNFVSFRPEWDITDLEK